MQLVLAYRFLRKISDWTMSGFYSEVFVAGQENVPQHGPIILAATHHNEIIDIAALSATIPYRRRICCWAKSTLFKHPFAGALLRSSGSIPVHRNPNIIGSHSGSLRSGSSTTFQAELFKHTSVALARGEVVGVFPEGTSYTEPAIAQVKEGAAWAAIEYVKTITAHSTGEAGKDLIIVPAAIVYTDKSRYQSRVLVRYGKPIHVNNFLAELNLEDDDSVRAVVKEITGEIYQGLREMTINAPDWDTYHSTKIATELAWGEDLSLGRHVGVSQILVELFSDESKKICSMKQSLVKYLGLLHYTGISHAALDYLYPLPRAMTFPSSTTIPTVPIATITMLCQLCKTFLHPSAIAFLPMFVLHLPVYIVGWLAARFLAKSDEEEAKAQFKAFFGGLAMGLSYGIVIRMAFKAFTHVGGEGRTTWLVEMFPPFFVAVVGALRKRLLEKEGGISGLVQELLRTVAVTVGAVRILWKWHNSLVGGNLERWRCLSASGKTLAGLISPTSNDLSDGRLEAYSRPPLPAENQFIKRRTPATVDVDARSTEQSTKITIPPPVSATKLIRPLLVARVNAVCAVRRLERVTKDRVRKEDEREDLPNTGDD